MRLCPSCRFLIGDHEAGCAYCHRAVALPAAPGLPAPPALPPASSPPSAALVLVRVSNALAIPDEPVRGRRAVATVPVPAHDAYPTPYPRPWHDVTGPPPVVAVPAVGAITRAARMVRSATARRRPD